MKLSSYENPLSGKRNNLFDIGNLWAQILGVFVLVMVFIFGQKLADFVGGLWGGEEAQKQEEATTRTRIVF